MTQAELEILLPKLRPWSDFLYFHLMGEPLCHPHLESFLTSAENHGFKVILTTNGTLLEKQKTLLLSAKALHKVNISLHAFEANDLAIPFETYLQQCFTFAKAAEGTKLVVFRLWNHGGADQRNMDILASLENHFPKPWIQERKGIRIGNRVYLEYGDKFDWPDLNAEDQGDHVFCYGLRDQIGVLCDGTVVPCCLDHDGDLALGNLLEEELDTILESDRARAIYQGFSNRLAAEELCRKCGYARRFG
jgi:radical SAM protein with 4Fe4S-binding SPASM domain